MVWCPLGPGATNVAACLQFMILVMSLMQRSNVPRWCPECANKECFTWIIYRHTVTSWGVLVIRYNTGVCGLNEFNSLASEVYMLHGSWLALVIAGSAGGTDTPLINSSPPSAAYMRQWIGSALVQIKACRLFGAKPLSKPFLNFNGCTVEV